MCLHYKVSLENFQACIVEIHAQRLTSAHGEVTVGSKMIQNTSTCKGK